MCNDHVFHRITSLFGNRAKQRRKSSIFFRRCKMTKFHHLSKELTYFFSYETYITILIFLFGAVTGMNLYRNLLITHILQLQ